MFQLAVGTHTSWHENTKNYLSRCSLRLQSRPPLLPGLLLFLLCAAARLLSFAPGHVCCCTIRYLSFGVSSWVLAGSGFCGFMTCDCVRTKRRTRRTTDQPQPAGHLQSLQTGQPVTVVQFNPGRYTKEYARDVRCTSVGARVNCCCSTVLVVNASRPIICVSLVATPSI